MAKQKKGKAAGGDRGKPLLSLDTAREYVVYWRSGLKSVCHGFRLSEALDFYLSRARVILDAETRKRVWEA